MSNDRELHPMARNPGAISRWAGFSVPRVGFCLAGYMVSMLLLGLAGFTPQAIFGRTGGASGDMLSVAVFLLVSMALLGLLWFASGVLPKMAEALGYRRYAPDRPLAAQADRSLGKPFIDVPARILAEKYDSSDILSPLESSRQRIMDHISKLHNNSVANLFIGIAVASIGIAVLVSTSFGLSQFHESSRPSNSLDSLVYTFVILNISIAIFAEIASYFFISQYRGNQKDIKYFLNEITSLDSLATAVIAAQRPGSSPNMKLVLTALSRNERNRLAKSDEKSALPSEDAEILRAVSSSSRKSSREEKVRVEQD